MTEVYHYITINHCTLSRQSLSTEDVTMEKIEMEEDFFGCLYFVSYLWKHSVDNNVCSCPTRLVCKPLMNKDKNNCIFSVLLFISLTIPEEMCNALPSPLCKDTRWWTELQYVLHISLHARTSAIVDYWSLSLIFFLCISVAAEESARQFCI